VCYRAFNHLLYTMDLSEGVTLDPEKTPLMMAYIICRNTWEIFTDVWCVCIVLLWSWFYKL